MDWAFPLQIFGLDFRGTITVRPASSAVSPLALVGLLWALFSLTDAIWKKFPAGTPWFIASLGCILVYLLVVAVLTIVVFGRVVLSSVGPIVLGVFAILNIAIAIWLLDKYAARLRDFVVVAALLFSMSVVASSVQQLSVGCGSSRRYIWRHNRSTDK